MGSAAVEHLDARGHDVIGVDSNMRRLETTRQHCPEAVFLHTGTNKVYGDAPNERSLKGLETRFDYATPEDYHGIAVDCRVDRTLHNRFGVSKATAAIVAEEYGRHLGKLRSHHPEWGLSRSLTDIGEELVKAPIAPLDAG